jgi:hypothetical protein
VKLHAAVTLKALELLHPVYVGSEYFPKSAVLISRLKTSAPADPAFFPVR